MKSKKTMTNETLIKTPGIGLNKFNSYLASHSEDAKTSKLNDLYYHVDVVAEAYSKGYVDGENSAKKEVMDSIMTKATESFVERANTVYLSTKVVLNHLKTKHYNADKIYINIFHKSPKVIVAVDESLLLDDQFVEITYSKIHEVQCLFHSLFESTLDLSLISTTDLDEKLLEKDGFDYSEAV